MKQIIPMGLWVVGAFPLLRISLALYPEQCINTLVSDIGWNIYWASRPTLQMLLRPDNLGILATSIDFDCMGSQSKWQRLFRMN
jgi:hypothetical protein